MKKQNVSLPFFYQTVVFVVLLIAMPMTFSSNDMNRDNSQNGKRKNIILFLTDDQDVTANSIHPSVMPQLHRLFQEGGMEFSNYYVSTGLCCPSRATILRGQYCHNTGILDNGDFNNETYQSGGWDKFLDTQLEQETIATLLRSEGYETALIGKYMNGYEGKIAGHHKPPGWDHWMGLLTCFRFYGPTFSENGKNLVKCNNTIYQTDYIRDWVLDFLENRDTNKPFFLMIAPFAPHAPAIPAKRHEQLFPDATFPRTEAFNPSNDTIHQANKPAWIRNLPVLTEQQLHDMDHFYANRLRSLQAVDEALESIASRVETLGLEDDTYFIYTSDNGQHFGDFRMPAGKRQAYETDVLVPFFVRGPGIQKGSVSSQVVQSVDLAPTFLDIATSQYVVSDHLGLPMQVKRRRSLKSSYPMDGQSILPLFTEMSNTNIDYNDFRWAALIEMYSGSSNIGLRYNTTKGYYHNHMFPNTYQALRIIDGPSESLFRGANLLYVEWCTGEQELYNMTADPHQIYNLIVDTNASQSKFPLVRELNRILVQLGNCKGSDCYNLESSVTRSNDSFAVFRSFETLQSSIRNRIPCHNPPNMTTSTGNERRKAFAYDLPVPEPFQHGFPFSDGEILENDLLRVWEEYEHYFY